MEVDVTCPKENYQDVMTSLTKRQGFVFHTESLGDLFNMKADVALSQMFGFSGDLRSLTMGQGEFSMEYKKHDAVSPDKQMTIIQEMKEKRSKRGY